LVVAGGKDDSGDKPNHAQNHHSETHANPPHSLLLSLTLFLLFGLLSLTLFLLFGLQYSSNL
jgi:hypothetical protein